MSGPVLCVECDRAVYGKARSNPGPRCWPCEVARLNAIVGSVTDIIDEQRRCSGKGDQWYYAIAELFPE